MHQTMPPRRICCYMSSSSEDTYPTVRLWSILDISLCRLLALARFHSCVFVPTVAITSTCTCKFTIRTILSEPCCCLSEVRNQFQQHLAGEYVCPSQGDQPDGSPPGPHSRRGTASWLNTTINFNMLIAHYNLSCFFFSSFSVGT